MEERERRRGDRHWHCGSSSQTRRRSVCVISNKREDTFFSSLLSRPEVHPDVRCVNYKLKICWFFCCSCPPAPGSECRETCTLEWPEKSVRLREPLHCLTHFAIGRRDTSKAAAEAFAVTAAAVQRQCNGVQRDGRGRGWPQHSQQNGCPAVVAMSLPTTWWWCPRKHGCAAT